ncbi:MULTISPECIES: succinate dehydrogenase assembly factor 2 [unclassified Nitrosomonas]|uniref:FAD assembly factor SdhE n=1 Tax=unclassified Nitrosomonas TaxID=2609265 RepID=UPI00089AF2DE|nr:MULTISPECIES: succinate dehydrogenase assembly factor 2 [unclassified Nitrosomonas]MDV6344551.1 succinate dehydrogenase assembly factor 2 [Nitrosomonas sp. Is37]SDY23232.1 antitoxin CptB [Nitrosomonas sp. Nm33]
MKQRERLRWRCRRGLLELDIILQRFLDKYYVQLDETQLKTFETLLTLPDNDLWDIISSKKETANENLKSVLKLLQQS